MSERFKLLIKAVLIILIILGVVKWIFPIIKSPEFELLVKQIGYLGPFVIIFVTVILHVFAPESSGFMLLLGFTVYGVVQTLLFLYIASMISAIINFKIAKKYGRGLVLKLVGHRAVKQIDKITEVSGGKILIFGRIIGFPIFEIISYAAGLTKISFKKYMTITLLFGALPNLAGMLILRSTNLNDPVSFYILFGGLVLVGLGFSLVMKEYVDKNINKSK